MADQQQEDPGLLAQLLQGWGNSFKRNYIQPAQAQMQKDIVQNRQNAAALASPFVESGTISRLMSPNPQAPGMSFGPPQTAMMPEGVAQVPPTPQAAPAPVPAPAQPVRKGSGVGPVTTPVTSRSDYDDLVARLNEKGLESLKGQNQGITDQAEMLKMGLKGRNELDLSPLMALTDSWTGSNLQKGYSKPDADKQQASIQTMTQALQKGRNDLSQNEIDLLKSQIGAAARREDSQAREKDRELSRQIAAQTHSDNMTTHQDKVDADRLTKASKDLLTDKPVAEAMMRRDEIGSVKGQIKDALTNPVANNMLPMALVKLYVNRVSQQELGGAKGAQDLMDRAEQFGQQMKSGTLTSENAKFMSDLTDGLEKHNNENLLGHIQRHANVYSKTAKVAPDDAADAISGGLYSQLKASSPKPQGTDPGQMSREQMLKELGG